MVFKYKTVNGICKTKCPFENRTDAHWSGSPYIGSVACQDNCPHNIYTNNKTQEMECELFNRLHMEEMKKTMKELLND